MMKVYLVYEHYFKSFDIVADESLTLVKIYSSEEAAYCAIEDLAAAQTDECIDYYYEEREVE